MPPRVFSDAGAVILLCPLSPNKATGIIISSYSINVAGMPHQRLSMDTSPNKMMFNTENSNVN